MAPCPRSRTSYNTGLPAPFAALTSPNPCPVTAFAEEQRRKCRAQDGGFGNPETLSAKGIKPTVVIRWEVYNDGFGSSAIGDTGKLSRRCRAANTNCHLCCHELS